VVLWSNHGWRLGEHGIWGKHVLFHEAINVPLMIRVPGIDVTGKSNALVKLVDLDPTLCELCGITEPNEQLEENSLVPVIQKGDTSWKQAAFCRKGTGSAVITERFLYVSWAETKTSGPEMLFDLVADSRQAVNLTRQGATGDPLTHLRQTLHAGWQAARPEIRT